MAPSVSSLPYRTQRIRALGSSNPTWPCARPPGCGAHRAFFLQAGLALARCSGCGIWDQRASPPARGDSYTAATRPQPPHGPCPALFAPPLPGAPPASPQPYITAARRGPAAAPLLGASRRCPSRAPAAPAQSGLRRGQAAGLLPGRAGPSRPRRAGSRPRPPPPFPPASPAAAHRVRGAARCGKAAPGCGLRAVGGDGCLAAGETHSAARPRPMLRNRQRPTTTPSLPRGRPAAAPRLSAPHGGQRGTLGVVGAAAGTWQRPGRGLCLSPAVLGNP